MGNQSFVSVLLRATAGELYKIRRRAMSKVLLIIGAALIVISFSFIALSVLLTASTPHCTSVGNGTAHCAQPSGAQLSQLTATAAAPLHLPAALTTTVGIIDTVGVVLIIVLAGTIVGGEYGVGTIRVLLTRGPSRTQYLLAKVLAILASIFVTLVILIPLGIIVGALYNLTTGIGVNFGFFTGAWVLHAIIYILLAALNMFLYALIALGLATLGKSTAAGIAGAVLWWFAEGLLGTILTLVGVSNPGTLGDILKAIPDYFISNNIGSLLSEQSSYLVSSANNTNTIPDWRAWLVIAAYLVVAFGITWWVLRRRDITN
jgi:ABC-type transport system involved in multi-copper enzyme maturation permease subunit